MVHAGHRLCRFALKPLNESMIELLKVNPAMMTCVAEDRQAKALCMSI